VTALTTTAGEEEGTEQRSTRRAGEKEGAGKKSTRRVGEKEGKGKRSTRRVGEKEGTGKRSTCRAEREGIGKKSRSERATGRAGTTKKARGTDQRGFLVVQHGCSRSPGPRDRRGKQLALDPRSSWDCCACTPEELKQENAT
jgi:hypothetical protein